MANLNNYKRRVTSTIGTSVKDYVKKQVRSNLDTFLENSQYGMDVTINGKSERIGIMTGAMSDTRDEVLVLSEIDTLKMGTLFEWENEFWVVVKREARVIKESFYGTAYRCNVDLKWVDDNGVLFSQKAYAKGRGLSSILVENKYTDPPVMARDVDTPITVITQHNPELEQDMRFLFSGQPYRVTFVDNLSIDGTTILGMYDDILHDGDDIINNIADYTDRFSIELTFDPNEVILKLDEPFTVDYNIIYNGEIIDKKDIIISAPEEQAEINGNVIIPLVEDDIPVRVSLAQNELIFTDFVIHSGDEWTTDNIFIIGPDKIVWDGSATYKLNNSADAEFILSFPPKVKSTVDISNNSVTVNIQDKYSGDIELLVISNTEEGLTTFTKTIEIVSMMEV